MKPSIRIDDPTAIDTENIDREISTGNHIIVQFSDHSYTDQKLSQLNKLCREHGDNIEIRFYGHYSSFFNFSELLKLDNVQHLSVDCLEAASNIVELTKLPNLKRLSLGVFNLADTEFLKYDNLKNLAELRLAPTKKGLNLVYLQEYTSLKDLAITEHTKNIEAIGSLQQLACLSLNSIKKASVEFVNKLYSLKKLSFLLGGRENINEIEQTEMEELTVNQVRGFNNVDSILKFDKLKRLSISNCIRLASVDFKGSATMLNYLSIGNCKNLSSLTSLDSLIDLHLLRIYQTNLNFDNLLNQLLPHSLKAFAFYTTKQKVDEEIQAELKRRGYSER